MNVHRIVILTGCLVLASAVAFADRQECQGFAPDPPGACFIDVTDAGFFGFISDAEGDTVVVGPLDGVNDFFQFPPNGGRTFIHQIDTDSTLFFCTGGPECEPTHIGPGRVAANVSVTPDFSLGCPTSIQVHGTVSGPGGDFTLRAALMVVPTNKSPSGCVVHTSAVDISQ